MKKRIALGLTMLLVMAAFAGCSDATAGNAEPDDTADDGVVVNDEQLPASDEPENTPDEPENTPDEPENAPDVTADTAGAILPAEITPLDRPAVSTTEEALAQLKAGNQAYLDAIINYGDISVDVRTDTSENGQHPYAVVITCSDSRVPPEHIFSAGVGDLFVIRTAGNVIGEYELGSIEYGAEHLETPLIVVMGHESCGAVGAAIGGHAEGNIQSIVDEIKGAIGEETDSEAAERVNITNSYNDIMESEIITHLVEEGKVKVVEAKYDIDTGEVTFFE